MFLSRGFAALDIHLELLSHVTESMSLKEVCKFDKKETKQEIFSKCKEAKVMVLTQVNQHTNKHVPHPIIPVDIAIASTISTLSEAGRSRHLVPNPVTQD